MDESQAIEAASLVLDSILTRGAQILYEKNYIGPKSKPYSTAVTAGMMKKYVSVSLSVYRLSFSLSVFLFINCLE